MSVISCFRPYTVNTDNRKVGQNQRLLLVTLAALQHRRLQGLRSTMADKTIFKVIFMNHGQIYEIYAREVGHGAMFGFVEIEELVFGERSSVVLDPSEEKIKTEFKGVKKTYLPMHSIVRIDEVDKQGTSKISKAEGGNVAQFPMPVYTPGGGNKR
jgi:hypothetical protein